MAYLEVEMLIIKDVEHQLQQVEQEVVCGFPDSASYHLENAKSFCERLIMRLEERLKELPNGS